MVARVYAKVRYTEHLVRLGLKSIACQYLHLSLISATILPFSSSLPFLCIPSSPLSLSCSLNSQLLSSIFLLLQPLGSSMLPPLHRLPLYLQGTYRTTRTGEGMRRKGQPTVVMHYAFPSWLSSRFEWTLVLSRAAPSACTMTP